MFYRYSICIFKFFLLLFLPLTIMATDLLPAQINTETKEAPKVRKDWPIKTKKQFTSNFMEDRPGRFHAGLDFRTFGQNLPLYAIEDGYVSRLNVSPWGYGRAIYIKGKSGKTYVYGHTDSFVSAIDIRVLEKQYKSKRYRVNFYPKKSELPIKKGQLIGYSGNTGIGPNHLHFEIRDHNNSPMNPELLGFTIEDSVPPVFTRVVFTPLTDSSEIDGQVNIKSFKVEDLLNDTIQIKGQVGVSVIAYDKKSNNPKNKLGVFEYMMKQNDDTIFFQQTHGFAYKDNRYAYQDRNYSYPKKSGVRAKNLYRSTYNNASFYKWAKKDAGVFYSNNLEGVNRIDILLSDLYGNSAGNTFYIKRQNEKTVNLSYLNYLQYKNPSQISIDDTLLDLSYIPLKKSSLLTKDLKVTFFRNSVRIRNNKTPHAMFVRNEKGVFKLAKEDKSFYLPYYNLEGGENEFYYIDKTVFGYKIAKIASKFFHKVTPDTSYEITLNKRQKLKVEKNSVKKRASYFLINEKNVNLNVDGFKRDREYKSYVISGRGKYLVKSIKEEYVPSSKSVAKMQLYTKSGRRLRYQQSNLGDTIVFNHSFGSIYSIQKDVKAPKITKINGGKSIAIEETGSGISSDKHISTTFNGNYILNRYDPERKVTDVVFNTVERKGTLVYKVRDRVGNSTKLVVEIK